MDPFNIYVWSLRTGQLMDILNGHTGPISSLAFSPNGALLVSGSWD
jgi:periodic tryptophan protein 2